MKARMPAIVSGKAGGARSFPERGRAGMIVHLSHRAMVHRIAIHGVMIHRAVIRRMMIVVLGERGRGEDNGQRTGGEEQLRHVGLAAGQWAGSSIQIAMATIITFSRSETKPSGTRPDPPTQAHSSSRFWT